MRRNDDLAGMLRRHSGLLVRAAIAVSLVMVVALYVSGRGGGGGGGGAEADARYAVVFDAGSTGSRIHVFKFYAERGGGLDLESDTFEAIKPGLSSYAADPEAAAASLAPLMDVALATVPEPARAATPIMVGATAGLRLLPEGKADLILSSVTAYLAASPFHLVQTNVRVIDGTEEGAFAWLTLNYLLGSLGAEPSSTVAAIDLGGGSVQQAFALSPEDAARAPDGPAGSYVLPLTGGGRDYHVYVHSYLGYGLMAGRAAVLDVEAAREAHPCVYSGHADTYEYGGQSYKVSGAAAGASFAACAGTIRAALRDDKECGAPRDECSFNGVWSGSAHARPDRMYVSSYFWDRAYEALIITDEDASTAEVVVHSFRAAAEAACSTALGELQARYAKAQEGHLPFLCLDLTFAHTLLTAGFKIPEESTVTLVKKIVYKGQEVEAAWPLGAAINLLA